MAAKENCSSLEIKVEKMIHEDAASKMTILKQKNNFRTSS